MEMRKISRCRRRFVDGAELGHFTSLFCRGRQRNEQKVITHVHSCCFANKTVFFSDVLVAVVVVICLSFLVSPAKTPLILASSTYMLKTAR